jgi:hypothetical protein
MLKSIIFLLIFVQGFALSAQEQATYDSLARRADVLLEARQFRAAAEAYSQAFQSRGWKGLQQERYNAARAWSMAGVPDSAFFQLYRITEKLNFSDLEAVAGEAYFQPIQSDPRWADLTARIKANQPTMPGLAAELKTILQDDQRYRRMIDSVQQRFGPESPEVQQLWKTMAQKDSVNLSKVRPILDRYGWLGSKEVGDDGASALFLVIQHSPLAAQEQYLPMMREAVKAGKARGASLALLEDRVNMRNGRKQVYGSQLKMDDATGKYVLFPIEDPRNVDKRRAEVGLGPLSEYIARWGLTWNEAEAEKMEKQPFPPKG